MIIYLFFYGKCGRAGETLGKRWGNAPLLWDPLSLPFVLGSRMAGSPASDRFVVFTWPAVNSGDGPVSESSPPTPADRLVSADRRAAAALPLSGRQARRVRRCDGGVQVARRTRQQNSILQTSHGRCDPAKLTSPGALHTNNDIYSFISTAAFFRKQSSRAKLSVYEAAESEIETGGQAKAG